MLRNLGLELFWELLCGLVLRDEGAEFLALMVLFRV